jgi:hypothetical protein
LNRRGDAWLTNFDFSPLSYNLRNTLFLAWISGTDFKELKKPENHSRLEYFWSVKKPEVVVYFQDQDIAFDTIVADLKEFVLTPNPKLSYGFDPKDSFAV